MPKNETIVHKFYYKKTRIWAMKEEIWKCFRCNLNFKDKDHAELHENITKHPISTEKQVAA